MAVAELIVSRRALLGAAWAISALAAPRRRPGPSPSWCAAPIPWADFCLTFGPAPAAAAAVPTPFPIRHPGLDPGSSSLSRHPGEGRDPDLQSEERWTPDRRVRGDEGGERRTERWNRALARFRAAEAALAAVAHAEDDDQYDRANGRFIAALKKLLRIPAPGASALALKLELAIDQLAWELTGGERCMAALLADARRLAASAA